MDCLIPIKRVTKFRTVTKNSEGKDEEKDQSRETTEYGHSSWLEEENQNKIIETMKEMTYKVRFAGVVTGIVSLLAVRNVPLLKKMRWQYKLAGVFIPGFVAYAIAKFFFGKKAEAKINKIVSELDYIPTWNHKDKVIEKNNIYFFLDDDKGFAPNILYHGISQKQIDNILPDKIYGNENIRKLYLTKFSHLLQNRDSSKTPSLLEELSHTPRTKRQTGSHH